MQKWEYAIFDLAGSGPGWRERAVARLNELGAQGWEMTSPAASGFTGICYFKRPIEIPILRHEGKAIMPAWGTE